MLDARHPANTRVLCYLGAHERLARSASIAADRVDCAPGEFADVERRLGTHPDLVEQLWVKLADGLPRKCKRIVYGRPALVHPASGVLFAFAGGTSTYALRLPPDALAEALAAGAPRIHRYPAYPELGVEASVFDLAILGDEWVFGAWNERERTWCAAAFAHAGTL